MGVRGREGGGGSVKAVHAVGGAALPQKAVLHVHKAKRNSYNKIQIANKNVAESERTLADVSPHYVALYLLFFCNDKALTHAVRAYTHPSSRGHTQSHD